MQVIVKILILFSLFVSANSYAQMCINNIKGIKIARLSSNKSLVKMLQTPDYYLKKLYEDKVYAEQDLADGFIPFKKIEIVKIKNINLLRLSNSTCQSYVELNLKGSDFYVGKTSCFSFLNQCQDACYPKGCSCTPCDSCIKFSYSILSEKKVH